MTEGARDLTRQTLDYLAAHNTVSLATHGAQGLWAATVFYASIDFALYFLSDPKTRHVVNVLSSPEVAATINEDYQDWREIKGIQMEGSCTEVSEEPEVRRALDAYTEKYPFVRQFLPPDGGLAGMQIAGRGFDVRLYRLTPARLWFIDNARGFSNREQIPLEAAK